MLGGFSSLSSREEMAAGHRGVLGAAGLEGAVPKWYHGFQLEVLCLITLLHPVCLDLQIHEVFGNLGDTKAVKAMDGF